MPFPYTVRISNRAKRLQIRIEPGGAIEVVVPRQFDMSEVAPFVIRQQAWIARTLQRLQQQPARPEEAPPLPETVTLAALNEQWPVRYSPHPRSHFAATARPAPSLQLFGSGRKHHHQALTRWLQQHAKTHLSQWLQRVSDELGLPFNKVTIRAQKTRWGSCSARGNISLNRNLLFLPPAAVRYLLIHELCHTVHLNHSRRYWSLVARMEPDYRQLDRSLRRAMLAIPRWALPHYAP